MNSILKGFSEFIGSSSPILQVEMLLPYGVRQYSKDFKTMKYVLASTAQIPKLERYVTARCVVSGRSLLKSQ